MSKIGMFYGSDGGVTKEISEKIADKLGKDNIDIFDIADSNSDKIASYDKLIIASSTWDMGNLQSDWEDFEEKWRQIDFNGKTIAYIGLGDQEGYEETFCDAIGILNSTVKGATIIGQTSTDGYEFESSKAVVDDKFIGLCLDEDNQDELTDERIDKWIPMVKSGFGL